MFERRHKKTYVCICGRYNILRQKENANVCECGETTFRAQLLFTAQQEYILTKLSQVPADYEAFRESYDRRSSR